MASATVTVEILFFAKAKEIVRKSSGELTLISPATPSQILRQVEASFPDLKTLGRTFVLALNEEYLAAESEEQLEVKPTDQLAVIPPISGG